MNKNKKILLVEDDSQLLEIMTTILSGENFDVIKCVNAHEAISRLRSPQYDFSLIITEFKLPDATGREVSEVTRKIGRFAQIPILLITANHSGVPFADLLNRKIINAYLAKPFARHSFILIVSLLLNQRFVPAINRE